MKVTVVVSQVSADHLSEARHELPFTVSAPEPAADRFGFGILDLDQEHQHALADAAAHLARIRKPSEVEITFRFAGYQPEVRR